MRAIRQIICLGIFNCLLITTYTSFSFIVTYIYEDLAKSGFKEMGPLILIVSYFTFFVTNSFAPGFSIRLKNQLKIAAFCYSISYCVEIPNFQSSVIGITALVIGAAFGGFGAAILWVCYGAYTTSICRKNDEEHLQGHYFAVLSGITFSSSIMGPTITTFCLGFLSPSAYFAILTGIGAAAYIFCVFFVEDIDCLAVDSARTLSWKQHITKSCAYYAKMKSLIALLILDGVCLGFLSASATKIVPSPTTPIKNGIFLIIMGVGSAIGALASGYLSDLFAMGRVGQSSVIVVLANCCLTLLVIEYPNTYFAMLCSFTWGFSLQYLEGWVYVACSRNFRGNLSAFANQKQVHSLSFCMYQVTVIVTEGTLNLQYVILCMILLSPVAYMSLNRLPKSSYKKLSEDCETV